jgi:hypothetical protein
LEEPVESLLMRLYQFGQLFTLCPEKPDGLLLRPLHVSGQFFMLCFEKSEKLLFRPFPLSDCHHSGCMEETNGFLLGALCQLAEPYLPGPKPILQSYGDWFWFQTFPF